MGVDRLNKAINIATVLSLASAVTACSENRVDLPPSTLAITTPVVPREDSALTQQFPAEIHKYYPQLEATGLMPRAVYSIPVPYSKIPTLVYNFSDAQFNPESARVMYDFFEEIASSPASIILSNYKIEEQDRDLVLTPRAGLQQRMTVIVPKNIPLPTGRTRVPNVVPAGTYVDYANNKAFSYVESESGDQNYFNTTIAFATESCQQTIEVTVRDAQGREVSGDLERLIAQEAVCNSFGTAVAAAEMGLTYVQYLVLTKEPLTNIPGTNNSYPHIQISQDDYNAIPKTGSIVR